MKKRVKVGTRWVGEGEPTYIIAEAGSNFDGSLERAKLLVDLAVQCGCDAIKFQSFLAGKIVNKDGFAEKSGFQAKWDRPVFEVYRSAEFPREWHKAIADYCAERNIDFFSSPYDREAVDLLEELGVPAHKIGSGEINNPEFLRYVARTGKPIIIGVGAAYLSEIDEAIRTIEAEGNTDIVILQCVTNYPSSFENANLRAMQTLAMSFQYPVGYSDHTPGSVVPLGAVALGGCMIEKHFTDDKTRKGPDHPFAMDVQDMTTMVQQIRDMEKALGSYRKFITPEEKATRIVQTRSLYAAVDIAPGTVITAEMLTALRPAKGLSPTLKDAVVGRTATTAIKALEPITWDLF